GAPQGLPSNPDWPPRRVASAGENIISAISDRFLEVLRRAERNLLAGLDLDGLAGCRIAAHARCALPDLKDAETRDANPLALLEMLGDEANQALQQFFAAAFGELMLLGQGGGEMLDGDRLAGLGCRSFGLGGGLGFGSRHV